MNRQLEQLQRNQEWQKEGHLEWPVQLDTYLKPHQAVRLEWLKANVQGRILEVGCSWGYVLAYMNGMAGVDLNPENIAVARQLARNRRFEIGDARALPFSALSFDTVVLADVLEHMDFQDVPQAISEACRVSVGLVLVTIPCGDDDTEDATNMKHRWLCTFDIAAKLFGSARIQRIPGFYCARWEWQDVRRNQEAPRERA